MRWPGAESPEALLLPVQISNLMGGLELEMRQLALQKSTIILLPWSISPTPPRSKKWTCKSLWGFWFRGGGVWGLTKQWSMWDLTGGWIRGWGIIFLFVVVIIWKQLGHRWVSLSPFLTFTMSHGSLYFLGMFILVMLSIDMFADSTQHIFCICRSTWHAFMLTSFLYLS